MDKIKQLQEIIDNSNSIVFFGGAGVSTESGLKDFRSVDGLYSQKYDYPPEEILSHDFFFYHTKEFYKFYKDKLLVDNVKPNPCHLQLAKLEQAGKLKAIITQNIDNSVYRLLSADNIFQINNYIEDPMTATWFKEERRGRLNGEQVTSELIYYWMISLNIPFECQKWHLSQSSHPDQHFR